MKVLAIVLFCAVAAAQGRSAVKVVDDSSSEVALETKPWVVHFRYAIRSSGLLQTATGSLISSRFALTKSDISDSSFIWVRLGVVNVIQPALVIESSAVQTQGAFSLVNMNREVVFSRVIAPIGLAQWVGPVKGESCGFGRSAINGPGEKLQCSNILVEESEDGKLIGSSEILNEFDLGAALVHDDLQSAVLVSVDGQTAEYAPLDYDLLLWVSDVANLPAPPPPTSPPQPDSSESNPESSESNPESSESNPESSESNPESSESNAESSESNSKSSESNSDSSESNSDSSESNSDSSESKSEERSRVKFVGL